MYAMKLHAYICIYYTHINKLLSYDLSVLDKCFGYINYSCFNTTECFDVPANFVFIVILNLLL